MNFRIRIVLRFARDRNQIFNSIFWYMIIALQRVSDVFHLLGLLWRRREMTGEDWVGKEAVLLIKNNIPAFLLEILRKTTNILVKTAGISVKNT
jgi:hypothetical protein